MRIALRLLLTAAPAAACLYLPPAMAQDLAIGQSLTTAPQDILLLAQAEDLEARVKAARKELKEARKALEEERAAEGDVETAEARVEAAEDALEAAMAALEQAQAESDQPDEDQAAEGPEPADIAEPDRRGERRQAEAPPEQPGNADRDRRNERRQAEAPPERPGNADRDRRNERRQAEAPPERPGNADRDRRNERRQAEAPPGRPDNADRDRRNERRQAEAPPDQPGNADRDRRDERRQAEAPPDQPGNADRDRRDDRRQAEAPPDLPDRRGETVVEQQLQALGDAEAADQVRALREKLNQALDLTQGALRGGDGADRDRRGDRDRRDRADRDNRRDRRDGEEVVRRSGDRDVVRRGNDLVVRRDPSTEADRFLYGARDVDVEPMPGGLTRTTITRRDGTKVVLVRDGDGDILRRSRIDRRGNEIVLFNSRDDRGNRPPPRFDRDLPPLRVDIPRSDYVVETRRADPAAVIAALEAPPVEQVERQYGLDEIRYSERLRDKLRRVDLDTITFDFGSAALTPSQFDALTDIGIAIEDYLADNPDEVFLVEGHTDAVGSDYDNLLLSDQRAEAVAVALSGNFDIPPENLVTQGYGEEFLKVPTQDAERENRRVALRRITPLLQGAQN